MNVLEQASAYYISGNYKKNVDADEASRQRQRKCVVRDNRQYSKGTEPFDVASDTGGNLGDSFGAVGPKICSPEFLTKLRSIWIKPYTGAIAKNLVGFSQFLPMKRRANRMRVVGASCVTAVHGDGHHEADAGVH